MVQDLYVLMITAAVVSILFKFLKQPVVLGYIVAGVLVGPYLFGKSLVNPDNVKQWGDIGVLFVLFCIGLEFRLKNLISSGKVAAIGALTIIVGMMFLGYLVGWDANFDMVNSLFLAGMLCMSSTTIVMKVIDEAGMSKERFVKGATSILIVEDVVAVVLMRGMVCLRHTDYPDPDTQSEKTFERRDADHPRLGSVPGYGADGRGSRVQQCTRCFRDGIYPCRDGGVASYRKADDAAEECLCSYLLHLCGYDD